MKITNPLKKKIKEPVIDKNNVIDVDFTERESSSSGKDKKKIKLPEIKNPIAEAKRKREEEQRRKEEEERRRREEEDRRRAEQERERRAGLYKYAAIILTCVAIYGVITLNERSEASKQTTAATPTVEATTPAPTQTPVPIPSSTPQSMTVSGAKTTPTPTPEVEESVPKETEEPVIVEEETVAVEEEETVEELVNPYHEIKKLSVSTRTDYAHFAESTVIQGDGETFYVIAYTNSDKATIDDVVMYYDESEIQVLSKDIIVEGTSNCRIEYHCQALKEGTFDVLVLSSYEDYEYEVNNVEPSQIYSVPILKLNWTDGQVVYVSDTGEKYHRTQADAGVYAEAVTLWDAESMGYEPCGKCY